MTALSLHRVYRKSLSQALRGCSACIPVPDNSPDRYADAGSQSILIGLSCGMPARLQPVINAEEVRTYIPSEMMHT